MTVMMLINQILGPFVGLLFTTLFIPMMRAQSKPEEVVFESDHLQLHGFLWKPSGNGPLPVVVWNHGSEKLPGAQPGLAGFYTEHSYVFFAPHRRGQGRSPGRYIQDEIAQIPPFDRSQRMISLQEDEVNDVMAAIELHQKAAFCRWQSPRGFWVLLWWDPNAADWGARRWYKGAGPIRPRCDVLE
jgi:hypothetical protein